MIIKIDHIALYSNHLEKSQELLERCGYQVKFTEVNVSNPQIKKSLMTYFPERYSLCYMSHDKNLDIEIVTAEVSSNKLAFLKPKLNGIGDEALNEKDNGLEKSLNELMEMMPLTDNNISNLQIIRCSVGKIESSVLFWKLFGFSEELVDKKKSMVFNSILPNQKRVKIFFDEAHDTIGNHFLNDVGFNCLAFITTSIDRDRHKFIKNGFEATQIEQIRINKRPLKVCFVIGKNGELAELIEMQKEA